MEGKLTKSDFSETAAYLGGLDALCMEQKEKAEAMLLKAAQPHVYWKLFPMTIKDEIPGADIKKLLEGCRNVVLFGATLGMETERLLRKAQVRSMEEALLLDACADSAIEAVCDRFCAELEKKLAPCYLTDRFSPGYGDLPLEFQKVIFQKLDLTAHCGIRLTDSCLMIPQKSVTAIIGISDTPKPQPIRGCEQCNLREVCEKRKERPCNGT